MKLLAVNKFFYKKGGSESYYFSLNSLLEENGHTIIPFSMKDEKNIKTEYDEYFIDNIKYENISFTKKLQNSTKIIYNGDAKKKIDRLIKREKPDIAHLHIFQHQMSPSIIRSLKKYNIPVVNTVHDLKVICPNYKMLNSNGICESCKGGKYINCLISRCSKGSLLGSAVNTIEAYLHNIIKSYDLVDMFICPSKFYRDKFIEFGVPIEKTAYIPNFINQSLFQPNYESKDYFVYFGRLSEEKGIKTLIKAMKRIKNSKLLIVGTGPLEKELKATAEEQKLFNVEFVGFKTGNELFHIIKNSSFVVVPSEWYENSPMSILESMALGKAVIGANIGGIPELITEGVTGYIFQSRDEVSLAEKITIMLNHKNNTIEMGKKARKQIENYYNKQIHYNKIMNVYQKLYEG